MKNPSPALSSTPISIEYRHPDPHSGEKYVWLKKTDGFFGMFAAKMFPNKIKRFIGSHWLLYATMDIYIRSI